MAKSITKTHKYVYLFGNKKADGNGSMKPLLGGKGANLAEMTRIGLPVPPGFTITTEVCTYYLRPQTAPIPRKCGRRSRPASPTPRKSWANSFGDLEKPLLVSVRSGARDSMPGMMDTILNLGLNDQTVVALEKASNNPRFAWDCYRRFIQMYGDVVMGVQKKPGEDHEPFETVIEDLKAELFPGQQHVEDTKIDADGLQDPGAALQEPGQGAHRQGLPHRSLGTARRRHRRRLRFLDERPRHRLSRQI